MRIDVLVAILIPHELPHLWLEYNQSVFNIASANAGGGKKNVKRVQTRFSRLDSGLRRNDARKRAEGLVRVRPLFTFTYVD